MGAQQSNYPPGSLNTTTMQGPQGALQSGAHSPLPVDAVPYRGPKLEYHMINITAKMDVQAGFFSGSMVTTNVDAYYPTLVQPYQHGFKMIQFQTIPGVRSQAGWFSQAVPFQAVLTRAIGVPPPHERWNLQIVKSFIELQVFYSFSSWSTNGQMANTTDVMTKRHHTIGIDLLFHVPQHPNPTPYVYHGIHVPISYKIRAGFGQPSYQCMTDLNAQFGSFLNQGWKLVEINLDSSQMQRATGFTTGQISMNSMWFFEKEAAYVNDPTPRWQGTIISYQHKIKAQFGGVAASRHNWDPILVEMGQRGWELTCILETPETRQSGLTTATTTVLLFFQRPIL
eukprot:XP_011683355.1 PREDICTED: uncharacterized protein LOC756089 [Strongylocentrotus purpuratus]